ncbi:hypothetical protein C9374_001999 [Naegleria lovaniensis]|uniref:Uncharacterized protein n=1 Tax=Naegleria lovaniensis TaxID=51637 RepID=A0AA88KMG9_NAELO|nr:uncharacterized protein C9374_001999 [Naegleria lovaniensis]KAG2386964.1 hypothetical protein C9374_001999 [Naegleria lovaniensis]
MKKYFFAVLASNNLATLRPIQSSLQALHTNISIKKRLNTVLKNQHLYLYAEIFSLSHHSEYWYHYNFSQKQHSDNMINNENNSSTSKEKVEHPFDSIGWNETKITRPSTKDIEIVEKQLNKKSKVVPPSAIVKRCKWGYPQVTFAFTSKNTEKNVDNNHFVPGTFLWLTCPRINHIVDKMETSDEFNIIRQEFGADLNFPKSKKEKRKPQTLQISEKKTKQEDSVTAVEQKETTTDLLMESFKNYDEWLSNKAKITEGQDKGTALLTPEEFIMWQYSVYAKDLTNLPPHRKRYGNAGVSVPTSIKCLHSHVASYMAGAKDHVGKRTFEEGKNVIVDVLHEADIEDLNFPLDCRSDCVRCRAFDTDFKTEDTQ